MKKLISKILIVLVIISVFSSSILIKPKISLATGVCSIQSARFDPSGTKSGSWYTDAAHPDVTVDIVTANCEGQTIQVSITELDFPSPDDDISTLDNHSIVVPTSNHMIIHMKAGEDECEVGGSPDCHYYLSVYLPGSSINDYNSDNKYHGTLKYNCDTACLDDWQFVSEELVAGPANTLGTSDPKIDYYPLAPLPEVGVECATNPDSNDPTNTNCVHTQPTDSNPCPFGDYLNALIKVFIGLCAVLAMIMIVIGGIEYMTSELISSKEEGKKRITGALFGLIIALSSYALLNTINPAVLQICLNKLPEATVTIVPASANEYKLASTQATDVKFKRTIWYEQIKTISALPEYNIPPCLLEAAIQRESMGVAGLVGHDENAPSPGIKSRRDFIASGLKKDGTTFTPNDTAKITDHTFRNNGNWSGNNIFSAPNPSAPDLGMDWRFSASMGMFGVTFFPHGSTAGANYDVGLPVTTIAGHTTVSPQDILNSPNIDMRVAAEIMHNFYNSCGQDVEKTYRKYGSGSCNGSNAFTNKEAPLRKSLYDQCVAQL